MSKEDTVPTGSSDKRCVFCHKLIDWSKIDLRLFTAAFEFAMWVCEEDGFFIVFTAIDRSFRAFPDSKHISEHASSIMLLISGDACKKLWREIMVCNSSPAQTGQTKMEIMIHAEPPMRMVEILLCAISMISSSRNPDTDIKENVKMNIRSP
ncbi:hypothetical protein G2W53_021329 [Senna tora]|uniref:Uncharacterized protein n=1 Tax=Senna tora TaxID=362788 RepID=A0A834TK03_9FABA|nr:hypothetical protein G2W53_021329 [Senna tora]